MAMTTKFYKIWQQFNIQFCNFWIEGVHVYLGVSSCFLFPLVLTLTFDCISCANQFFLLSGNKWIFFSAGLQTSTTTSSIVRFISIKIWHMFLKSRKSDQKNKTSANLTQSHTWTFPYMIRIWTLFVLGYPLKKKNEHSKCNNLKSQPEWKIKKRKRKKKPDFCWANIMKTHNGQTSSAKPNTKPMNEEGKEMFSFMYIPCQLWRHYTDSGNR